MSPLPASCLAARCSPTPNCFTFVALLLLLPVLQCLPPTPPPLHLATSCSSMKAHPRRLCPGLVPFLPPKTLHASITSPPWNTITNCSMGLSSPLNLRAGKRLSSLHPQHLGQCFSTGSGFSPQGICDNVWRHFICQHQVGGITND